MLLDTGDGDSSMLEQDARFGDHSRRPSDGTPFIHLVHLRHIIHVHIVT